MTGSDANDWVRQGTPRDDDTSWDDDGNEYGHALSPMEWDDHASEQSVPVTPPRPRPRPVADDPRAGHEPHSEPAGEESSPTAEDNGGNDGESWGGPEPADPLGEQPEATAQLISSELGPEHLQTADLEPEYEAEHHEETQQLEHDLQTADLEPEYEAEHHGETQQLEHDLQADEGTDPDEIVVVDQTQEGTQQVEHDLQADGGIEPDDIVVVDQTREETVVVEDPTAETPELASQTVDESSLPSAEVDEPQAEETTVLASEETTVLAEPAGQPTEASTEAHQDTEPTQQLAAAPLADPAWDAEAQAEEQRRQAELEADRRAREQRLGILQTSEDNSVRRPKPEVRRSTDGFLGSLGLFVVRIVTAVILGVIGYQILSNLEDTETLLSQTVLPEPRLFAWIVGFLLLIMAVLLVIGLLQRVVGLVLAILAVCSLAFIRWGAFSPFVAGREGFLGDRDLLLFAIGLLLLCLGGGRWGFDGAIRSSRRRARAERDG